jgi:hypothetical protein
LLFLTIAKGEATVSMDGILLISVKTVTFFVFVTVIGAWLFPVSQGFTQKIPVMDS